MAALFGRHLTLGFRNDGRRAHEIRKVECQLSVMPNANGSASFNIGNTNVIASVYGPQHPKNRESRQNRDKATIIVRCTTSSFSSTSHRDISRNYKSDRLISNTIKSTFDSIIMKHLYPKCSIEIVIEIIQNDGGELSAAINATTLALIDAGIGLNEYCVSSTAGYLDGHNIPFLDLNYMEKTGTQNFKNKSFKSEKQITTKARYGNNNQNKLNQQMQRMPIKKDDNNNDDKDKSSKNDSYCSGQLTLAIMPVSNKIITMQMQSIIDIDKMEKLLQICESGCKEIHKTMKKVVKEHSFKLMQMRGFINR